MKSIRTLFFSVFALLTLHANAAQADFFIKIYYHENPRIGKSPDTDAWIKGRIEQGVGLLHRYILTSDYSGLPVTCYFSVLVF